MVVTVKVHQRAAIGVRNAIAALPVEKLTYEQRLTRELLRSLMAGEQPGEFVAECTDTAWLETDDRCVRPTLEVNRQLAGPYGRSEGLQSAVHARGSVTAVARGPPPQQS
jgi:hypothetical protein